MIALVDLKKKFEKLCSQYEGHIAKARKSLNDQVSGKYYSFFLIRNKQIL